MPRYWTRTPTVLTTAWLSLLWTAVNAVAVPPQATGDGRVCPFPLPTFDCPLPSPSNTNATTPMDASKLRPSQVQFIMAAGDSVSAGLFSTWTGSGRFSFLSSENGVFTGAEHRTSSVVTGTSRNMLTLHNLLQRYSPDLLGGSHEDTPLRFMGHSQSVYHSTDLNAAVSAAMVQDLPAQFKRLGKQLDHYGSRLRAFPNGTTFAHSWMPTPHGTVTEMPVTVGAKLLSVMVGGINACWQCSPLLMQGKTSLATADSFITALNDSLTYLYTTPVFTRFRVPTVSDKVVGSDGRHRQSLNQTISVPSPLYVSVALLPRQLLDQLRFVRDSSVYCSAVQSIGQMCKCAYGADARQRQHMLELVVEYNAAIRQLVAEWQVRIGADGRQAEFRVVVNSALEEMVIMTPRATEQQSVTYNGTADAVQYAAALLNPVDCFHPGKCMHEAMATALWNQLFINDTTAGPVTAMDAPINRILAQPRDDYSSTPRLPVSPVKLYCPSATDHFV